jgi:hypothetical protein
VQGCLSFFGRAEQPTALRHVIEALDASARDIVALDALLRVPLRELQGRWVVQEVTGRGSFRTFAI